MRQLLPKRWIRLNLNSSRSSRRRLAYCGIAFAFAADLYFFLLGFKQPAAPIEFSRSIVLWIGTITLFLAVKFRPPAIVESLLKPIAFIGLVSYPLYLLHQDLGQMILNYLDIPNTTTAKSILLRGIVLIPFMIVFAGVIHRAFEKPFMAPLTAMLPDGRNEAC
jgi:peptidoglycan/LPS O-acetylase OafA/YrhL